VVVSFISAACGSSGGGPATPAAPQLQVGGAYQITKTITENTCDGNLTPAGGSGSVTHAPGGSTFTLSDSFTQFPGTVQANGTFTIASQATAPHLGAPVTTAFESGRFTTAGLEALVRLDINGPLGQPPFSVCRVTQRWQGIKLGSPNVIP
jgi:hypothetical protein